MTSFVPGSSSDQSSAKSAATDSSGNVLVMGSFTGTLTFGSATFTSASEGVYVAKLDPAGSVLWAVRFSGIRSYGIAVDSVGDAIVVGSIDSFTDLAISSITLTQQGSGNDMVVIKLDGDDGQAVWARNFGGDATSEAL